jgi:hypothetical protein
MSSWSRHALVPNTPSAGAVTAGEYADRKLKKELSAFHERGDRLGLFATFVRYLLRRSATNESSASTNLWFAFCSAGHIAYRVVRLMAVRFEIAQESLVAFPRIIAAVRVANRRGAPLKLTLRFRLSYTALDREVLAKGKLCSLIHSIGRNNKAGALPKGTLIRQQLRRSKSLCESLTVTCWPS